MNPRLLKHYVKYWLRAKNRHGLHSPFVYQLLDKVVYDFKPYKLYAEMSRAAQQLPDDGLPCFSTRVNRLLYRLMAHFKPAIITLGADVSNITALYLNAPPALYGQNGVNMHQCRVCDAGLAPTLSGRAAIETICSAIQPGDMLMMTNIYQSPQAMANWQRVKQQPGITVTINFFYFGLAFCRPGQRKEDFMLRF